MFEKQKKAQRSTDVGTYFVLLIIYLFNYRLFAYSAVNNEISLRSAAPDYRSIKITYSSRTA